MNNTLQGPGSPEQFHTQPESNEHNSWQDKLDTSEQALNNVLTDPSVSRLDFSNAFGFMDSIIEEAKNTPEEPIVKAQVMKILLSAHGEDAYFRSAYAHIRKVILKPQTSAEELQAMAEASAMVGLDEILKQRVCEYPSETIVANLLPLVGKLETCRQDEAVREVVAVEVVTAKYHDWETVDGSEFNFSDAELQAAANTATCKLLDDHESFGGVEDLKNAISIFENYQLSPDVVNVLVAVAKNNNTKFYRPFLASRRIHDELPELHENMMALAFKHINLHPGQGIPILEEMGPAVDAPWTFELVKKILEDKQSLLYFCRNLKTFSASLPNFDELCSIYDIDPQFPGVLPNGIVSDEWAFTSKKAQLAGFINRVQWQKVKETDAQNVSLINEPTRAFLQDIQNKISVTLQNLTKRMQQDSTVPKADCAALPSFKRSAEAMTARLVSNYSGGSLEELNNLATDRQFVQEVDQYIRSIGENYYSTYDTHIKEYDKVYEHFDELRRTKQPLEIYLGRDGVYAYFGRQAQRAARRSAGQQAPEAQYIIYNRAMRDGLGAEVKVSYLQQQGILLNKTPVFFDTGYEGTIPHDILTIMGADRAVINQSIRLLSSVRPEWRVPRGYIERADAVDTIEKSAKDIKPVEGLIKDENGLLRPATEHTSPEQQMRFAVVRRAILRHYFIKEQARIKSELRPV